jgi:cell division septal protein FtsQ
LKRTLAVLALVLVAVFAVYYFFVRDTVVTARLQGLELAATIGSGEDAVPVNGSGEVLTWLTLPEDLHLPELPLDEPPNGKRVKGQVLEQARVLGAVPPLLRPYVASSRYGESGVVVELDSGIELGFGDASQAALKWKAAAAILADPETEALDYVDLHSPARPAIEGEGHLLPPAP